MENWKQLGALNDPDALYNALMFSKPFAAEDLGWQGYFGAGIGRFGYIWPGPNTTIGFENGTTVDFETVSGVIGDFTGVTDGDSFYQKFCNPNPPPSNTTTTPTPTPSATIVPGYPPPVVISHDYIVSGYYLNSTENSDVAVLSMITFEPKIPREFQSVVQNFLADAKAAGKTKLVIDVSANGGGIILQGYDTFRQLFPQIEQDGELNVFGLSQGYSFLCFANPPYLHMVCPKKRCKSILRVPNCFWLPEVAGTSTSIIPLIRPLVPCLYIRVSFPPN